ncbi:MAG: polysaccharide pyruvyl transferase family protein, partial [Bacteroidales bacterium]|nr:polysaccharide pyruvyl transferase family protein [Bacteroidales bacterium]
MKEHKKEPETIVLLGASMNTGNLGVSALAVATLNLLWLRWPKATIEVLGNTRDPMQSKLRTSGEVERVFCMWPLRFCANPFVPNHFVWVYLALICVRVVPLLRRYWGRKESTLGLLCRGDMFLDITGGDSFSDIYGLKRFILGYLTKRVCMVTGKSFIMLPQTYGPFARSLTRHLAKSILKRCDRIYSRDREGIECISTLLSKEQMQKVQLCPDVAFTLPALSEGLDYYAQLKALKAKGQTLVGLNVSGLLYNGGYTGKNEFGLACDYKSVIHDLVQHFLKEEDLSLVLIPHVISETIQIENDLFACQEIYHSLAEEQCQRVLVIDEAKSRTGDPCGIKAIVGLCDFFMGSRMHATIASLSQCIPTVGLAYSKKFIGVYETIGVPDCVIDLRRDDQSMILETIVDKYRYRKR